MQKDEFESVIDKILNPGKVVITETKDESALVTTEESKFDIFDCFEIFIQDRQEKGAVQPSTIQVYKIVLKQLKEYQSTIKYLLSFEGMNSDFYDDYVA